MVLNNREVDPKSGLWYYIIEVFYYNIGPKFTYLNVETIGTKWDIIPICFI